MKTAIRNLREYKDLLQSKLEKANKILDSLSYKKHNPVVTKQIKELNTIIKSIKI